MHILAPLLGKTDHHAKNFQEFATEIKSVLIENGESFVSHDVFLLFTNTLVKEAFRCYL